MISWRSICFAVALSAASATPAFAGLEFADVAVTGAGNGSSAAVRFNGSAANAFSGVALPQNFATSGDRVLITADLADASVVAAPRPYSLTAELNFRYTGNPFATVKYDTNIAGAYNMIIQFGTISIASDTSLMLQSIGFEEGNSGTSATWSTNQSLTSAMSGQSLFLLVDPAAVPAALRDNVTAVRLDFVMSIGPTAVSSPTVGINAVVNPEPGTFALFAFGLLGVAGVVRARRKSLVLRPKTA
jgi:hypothetical protein